MRKKWYLWAGIVVVVLVTALVVAHFVHEAQGKAELERELEAWRQIGGPMHPAELAPEPAMEGENAAVIYERLFLELGDRIDLTEFRQAEDQAQFERLYGHILSDLHEAGGRLRCVWNMDYSAGILAREPPSGLLYKMIWLLKCEAELRALTGDLEGALDSIEAGLRLGDHVSEGSAYGTLFIMAQSFDAIMLELLEELFRDRDLPSTTIGEVLMDKDYHTRYHRNLLCLGASIISIFGAGEEGPGESEDLSEWVSDYLGGWREYDQALLLRRLRSDLERSERPWYEVPPPPSAPVEPPWWAQWGSGIFDSYDLYESTENAHVLALLAQTALQLRRHKSRKAVYPDTFETPMDPFDGKPIRYRKRKDGFELWSVGENRADDDADEDRDDIVWWWNR